MISRTTSSASKEHILNRQELLWWTPLQQEFILVTTRQGREELVLDHAHLRNKPTVTWWTSPLRFVQPFLLSEKQAISTTKSKLGGGNLSVF